MKRKRKEIESYQEGNEPSKSKRISGILVKSISLETSEPLNPLGEENHDCRPFVVYRWQFWNLAKSSQNSRIVFFYISNIIGTPACCWKNNKFQLNKMKIRWNQIHHLEVDWFLTRMFPAAKGDDYPPQWKLSPKM